MSLHFSKSEFASRLYSVQAAMAKAEADAMLLFNPASHFWLTGYDTFGYCFFQCLVVKSDGRTALLTRSADLRQAELTSNIEDIRVWTDKEGASATDQLRVMLLDLGLAKARLGVEYDTHGLTAANGRKLDRSLHEWQLEDRSDLIARLRVVKSAAELTYVRRAGKLADLALDAAIDTTRAGANEGEILAAMHHAIFANGGDYPGNPFIIGSGRDALLCRYKSGRRKLDNRDQLTLEWAGVERHYHAAGMRTLIVGTPDEIQIRMFDAARAALLACEAELRPGRSFGDVFTAHARTLDEMGMSEHRLNACGYSLGTVFAPSWMDWPMFYEGNSATVQSGMVLFLHMIIMDSQNEKAMCLGRTSIVGEDGLEGLLSAPLELIAR